jgi:hypothetical protein
MGWRILLEKISTEMRVYTHLKCAYRGKTMSSQMFVYWVKGEKTEKRKVLDTNLDW